jgi:hypothetical protein
MNLYESSDFISVDKRVEHVTLLYEVKFLPLLNNRKLCIEYLKTTFLKDTISTLWKTLRLNIHKTAFIYLCTYDIYSPVHNVLEACISITRGSGRGLALEFSSFLGPVKWH